MEHLREVGDTPLEEIVDAKSSIDPPIIDESESFPNVESNSTTQPADIQLDSPKPTSSQISTTPVTNQSPTVSHRYPRRICGPPNNNQAARLIPSVDSTVHDFERNRGQLTLFSSFGEDPLQGSPNLAAQREAEFYRQHPHCSTW